MEGSIKLKIKKTRNLSFVGKQCICKKNKKVLKKTLLLILKIIWIKHKIFTSPIS